MKYWWRERPAPPPGFEKGPYPAGFDIYLDGKKTEGVMKVFAVDTDAGELHRYVLVNGKHVMTTDKKDVQTEVVRGLVELVPWCQHHWVGHPWWHFWKWHDATCSWCGDHTPNDMSMRYLPSGEKVLRPCYTPGMPRRG